MQFFKLLKCWPCAGLSPQCTETHLVSGDHLCSLTAFSSPKEVEQWTPLTGNSHLNSTPKWEMWMSMAKWDCEWDQFMGFSIFQQGEKNVILFHFSICSLMRSIWNIFLVTTVLTSNRNYQGREIVFRYCICKSLAIASQSQDRDYLLYYFLFSWYAKVVLLVNWNWSD